LVALLLSPAGIAAGADDIVCEPKIHQELEYPPGSVTVAFEHIVDASTAKLLVTNSKGQDVTRGPLYVDWTQIQVDLLLDLPKDTYTVEYRVNDTDGVPMGGAYQFSYGKGKWKTVEGYWRGEAEVPDSMENLEPHTGTSGAATVTPTATAEPTEQPTVEPTPEVSVTPTQSVPTAEPTPESTGEPTASEVLHSILPQLFAGGALLLVLAVVALAYVSGRGGKRH
jgi:methionine-rich copper-binding protein CopC